MLWEHSKSFITRVLKGFKSSIYIRYIRDQYDIQNSSYIWYRFLNTQHFDLFIQSFEQYWFSFFDDLVLGIYHNDNMQYLLVVHVWYIAKCPFIWFRNTRNRFAYICIMFSFVNGRIACFKSIVSHFNVQCTQNIKSSHGTFAYKLC